jgi:hypothetical protein
LPSGDAYKHTLDVEGGVSTGRLHFEKMAETEGVSIGAREFGKMAETEGVLSG